MDCQTRKFLEYIAMWAARSGGVFFMLENQQESTWNQNVRVSLDESA
jgi:hypothetical protein